MVLEVLVAVVVLAAVAVLEGIAGVVVEATTVEVAARILEALVSVQLQPQLGSSLVRRKGKRRHRSRLPMSWSSVGLRFFYRCRTLQVSFVNGKCCWMGVGLEDRLHPFVPFLQALSTTVRFESERALSFSHSMLLSLRPLTNAIP